MGSVAQVERIIIRPAVDRGGRAGLSVVDVVGDAGAPNVPPLTLRAVTPVPYWMAPPRPVT